MPQANCSHRYTIVCNDTMSLQCLIVLTNATLAEIVQLPVIASPESGSKAISIMYLSMSCPPTCTTPWGYVGIGWGLDISRSRLPHTSGLCDTGC